MSTFSQLFPPAPRFTEASLESLHSKVRPPPLPRPQSPALSLHQTPPPPLFSSHSQPTNLIPQVFIVTGSTSGVGFELAKILYSKHGIVYVTGRSEERAHQAISKIAAAFPKSRGRLMPLIADFSSLATIKPAVDKFLASESRLDVLFLNAGVMTPPAGSKSADVSFTISRAFLRR